MLPSHRQSNRDPVERDDDEIMPADIEEVCVFCHITMYILKPVETEPPCDPILCSKDIIVCRLY